MAVVKREDDFSGYKFANDGSSVTLSVFSDREATDIVIPSHAVSYTHLDVYKRQKKIRCLLRT